MRATLARRARTAVQECLGETRSELTLLFDYEQLIDTFHVNYAAIVYMPGILDSFCSGGLNVGAGLLSQLGVLPQIAPCLEHVCAGGGG